MKPAGISLRSLSALLGAALFPVASLAQTADPRAALPLWEIGVGAVGRMATEYPGADSYNSSLNPIPHLIYRGRFLELGGEDGLRLVPFRTDRFEFGFSLDTSERVVNRVSELGDVLPDLDAQVEFGPEIIYRLKDTATLPGRRASGRLELLLQTRGVFGVDGGVDYEGALIRPALRYREYGTLAPGSRVQASIGPIFATQGVQQAYYGIDASDGTPDYDAEAGYLGTEARTALRYPLTSRLQLIGGVAVSYLGGAANEDSPLMRSRWDATAYLGLTFSLFQSDRRSTIGR